MAEPSRAWNQHIQEAYWTGNERGTHPWGSMGLLRPFLVGRSLVSSGVRGERQSLGYRKRTWQLARYVLGNLPGISHLLYFDIYQPFHYLEQVVAFPEDCQLLGRWLGPSHDVGQALCYYWIMKPNGKVISRLTAKAVTKSDIALDVGLAADIAAMDKQIADKFCPCTEVAFKPLEMGAAPPDYNKEIPLRMIFDVKMNFTRKARLVAGGHLTDPPEALTYSRLAFMLAKLNGLDMIMTNIGKAYLNAEVTKKYSAIAGPEFRELQGDRARSLRFEVCWCPMESPSRKQIDAVGI